MRDYSNLLERLERATDSILGNEHPKKRLLADAYVFDLIPLMVNEFPPELQAEWTALNEAMGRVPDERNGSARASVAAMRDDEVQRWCDAIVRIHLNILSRPRR